MLRLFGEMRVAELAASKDDVEKLKIEAAKGGASVSFTEDGNYLYGKAIFLGYDLPNGNGDAIPSFFAGTFGPSFIEVWLAKAAA